MNANRTGRPFLNKLRRLQKWQQQQVEHERQIKQQQTVQPEQPSNPTQRHVAPNNASRPRRSPCTTSAERYAQVLERQITIEKERRKPVASRSPVSSTTPQKVSNLLCLLFPVLSNKCSHQRFRRSIGVEGWGQESDSDCDSVPSVSGEYEPYHDSELALLENSLSPRYGQKTAMFISRALE